ncbi:MAG: helix-turn-helix domain-containing protein [Lacinutrix venerupis]
MINITTIDTLPKNIFKLKEKLGGVLTETKGVYTLKLDELCGKGEIKQYILNNGIVVYKFNIALNNDLVFEFETQAKDSLFFAYCTQGTSFFKSNDNEKYNKTEELRPTILLNNLNTQQNIIIKKDLNFTFDLIEINNTEYFNSFTQNNVNANLEIENLVNYLKTHKSHTKLNAYNLKVSDKLRETNIDSTTTPLTGLLKTKSTYLYILALYLEQFYNEVYNNKITSTLSKSELQKVRLLTDFIVTNPELQHTINSLCQKISMSPAKLQEGFKAMHDTTVADFVRNIRVEKAEKLLLETDLNISEIVYSIGLTSRSYFCKIFKHKYNCSPKRYRKISLNKY